MPLIRYELRDHAEAGSPCGCGRGLPSIARILGRTRNMVTLPNGAQHWPVVGYAQYREIAPVRQFQLIQQNLHQIEVRLVTDRSLNGGELAALTRTINSALGHEFRLNFVFYQNEIPRAPGGKFEEFISRLPA
jgi:phenylacetate-CoA ligase